MGNLYPFTNTDALKALDEMQRDLIPYVGIECRSGKKLLCTARQCAIKCIELLRLERAYGSSSSEFIGFVLPDLQETSETDKIEEGIACMVVGEQIPVLPDPPATNEIGVGTTMFPEEQTSSNDATTGEEKGIVGTSETSAAEVLAKKKHPQSKQNLAIKVTVTWNSEHLAFHVKYDVLKCNEVMSSINSVIQKQKNRTLSNGQFSYFFKLTDEELEVVKGSICSSLNYEDSFGHVLRDCDFEKSLEQFRSCFSFVFGLKGKEGLGYIFKTFPRDTLRTSLENTETKLRRCKYSLSLLSLDKVLLHEVIGFKDHRYFVYERLHQISPDAAKQCLVELLEGVKTAIDNLHSYNFAHLDVRLPNVCLKVEPNDKATVMLIDLERSQRVTLSDQWNNASYISCMYKVGLSYQQIDYMQLYWMGFWILLPEKCKSLVDYHDMNNMSDKELSNNEHLVAMRDFINVLPAQHDDKQWKKFMKMLSATGHQDSKTLLAATFVPEESAAEWCEWNEEILQLLEAQRRANMEDVEFLECQEEMNEQVLEQYTLVERVIAARTGDGQSQQEYLCKWRGLPYSECTWEDSSLIADRFLEQIDSFLCRNQAETVPSKSANVYCERRRGRSG
ncbi:hypothetical protein EMCRGX_G020886 [Ephydatia muelleri]